MADKLDLNYENDYDVSDSDEEYTQRERNLLKKVRKGNKKNDESDEEVLKFSSDDEPEKFEADSDFDGNEQEDGLPDTRSWGKKKSTFYNTDFHDNDYRTYTEKEEEIANQEQQEALDIQKRLASELNETDFNIEMFALPQEEQQEELKISATKTDLSDLSKKQKLALFKSEAPEFDGLVQDFSNRMTEYKELLQPTLDLFKAIDFTDHPFIEFIKCRSELILNYSTNISFYLMLKAKRMKVKNHPIVKRLVQFRQLICQLDDIFEYVVKPQIETLLAEIGNADDEEKSAKLKMLENLKLNVEMDIEDSSKDTERIVSKPLFHKHDSESDNEDEKGEKIDEGDKVDKKGGKREITRQIAKNKGLTASKRRELRNPRVKNKLKFVKAVKRRKGAVQPIRSKVELYGGEATGIKTHVKRSVKIK
ncbi:unnamed protein product [Chironomus riparius]|uniref:Sas10 C-terminal domain-containing protein n=1 Tax=Chironomus riparius TaxID=315576 RepID=A0A9N9WYA3_9DIPT|nr:unnamed protein product [Chironomus riparius]